MATKSNKGANKKLPTKNVAGPSKGAGPKAKKDQDLDQRDDLDEELLFFDADEKKSKRKTGPKKSSKAAGKDQDDQQDFELDVDDWNRADDQDDWDPDFDEFDIPTSKSAKKTAGGKKKGKVEDEEEFKFEDDDFQDLDFFDDDFEDDDDF